MSTMDVPSDAASGSMDVGDVDLKFEVVVIPVADVDRAKDVLRGARVAAGRRLPLRQRLPGRPVHPARLGVLGAVRHEHHVRRARLCPGPVPDRLRHPGRARRARGPRRRRQRGVPPGSAGRPVPARRGRVGSAGPRPSTPATAPSPPSATRTATLVAAGGHHPAARPDRRRPRRHSRRGGPGRARCGARRPPTASTRSAPGEADPNWPDWYAEYMVASRPATSCRREHATTT